MSIDWKRRWEAANKKKVWYGVFGAVLVMLLLTVVVGKCSAGELSWGGEPFLFFGLEQDVTGSLGICAPYSTNKWSANVGAAQPIFSWPSGSLNLQWTHHSCAFDDDWDIYDGVGINMRWYPTRIFK